MANIQILDHGQPNWDKVFNQIVATLTSNIENVVTTSDWVSDGIVPVNGFQIYSDNLLDVPAFQAYKNNGTPTVMLLKGSFITSSDITAKSAKLMTMPSNFHDFWTSKQATQVTWFGFTDQLQPINFHYNQGGYIELGSTVPINTLGRIQINTIFRG